MRADSIFVELDGGVIVRRTRPEDAPGLEELQRVVFPTLADEQRFKARHYLRHIELFPEGQFCAVASAANATHTVGMTSTVRLDFDVDLHWRHHTFAEIIQGGWLTSHQPDGRWLYGADVGTHPEYRRRGIARALYAARHDTVRRLGLAGQVTVGMPSGYGPVKHEMNIEDYYAQLISGARWDPTVSAQMRIGFEPRGLIPSYIDDPVCDGHGVLLVLPADRDVPVRRPP